MKRPDMNWIHTLRAQVTHKHPSGADTFRPPSGGLALARRKPGLGALGEPVAQVPLPDQLVLPLLDYSRQVVDATVRVGDKVQPGDSLGHGVLASAFGTVQAIEERSIIHPSNCQAPCVIINVDQHDNDTTDVDAWDEQAILPPLPRLNQDRLASAGIAGLGGAGYATADKIRAVRNNGEQIELLLINAVECEPDISCDETLVRSDPQAIIEAIHCLVDFIDCKRCIIAIEDDKPEAAALLRDCIKSQRYSQSARGQY